MNTSTNLRAFVWALATCANIVLLLLCSIELSKGMPTSRGDLCLAAASMLAPLLSLLALLPHYCTAPVTWLSLYLSRKAAEERSKIDALARQQKPPPTT